MNFACKFQKKVVLLYYQIKIIKTEPRCDKRGNDTMNTINVKEKEITTDEELFLSIKNRETDDVVDEILQERYGWAYGKHPENVNGYVWAKHASGYGHYIIYYEVYNFPIADVDDRIKNNWDDFVESVDDESYDFYLVDYFEGKIEDVKIN